MDNTKSLLLTEDLLGLVTDLYQLSMAAGYFEQECGTRQRLNYLFGTCQRIVHI